MNSSILHTEQRGSQTQWIFPRQKDTHRGYLQPNKAAGSLHPPLCSLWSDLALEGDSLQINWGPALSPSPEGLLSLRSLYSGPWRDKPHQAEISLCKYPPGSEQHRIVPISESKPCWQHIHCIMLAGSRVLLLSLSMETVISH